jgi:hypothetical protein
LWLALDAFQVLDGVSAPAPSAPEDADGNEAHPGVDPELSVVLVAPALDRPAREHGAGVLVARGDRGRARDAADDDRGGAIRRRPVAELAVAVVAPAGDGAAREEGAGVVGGEAQRASWGLLAITSSWRPKGRAVSLSIRHGVMTPRHPLQAALIARPRGRLTAAPGTAPGAPLCRNDHHQSDRMGRAPGDRGALVTFGTSRPRERRMAPPESASAERECGRSGPRAPRVRRQ